MKKFILFIIITSPFLVLCQTEKEISKKISAEFEKNYNSDEYQEIFKMFSDEMKTYLPIEQTTDFLKGLNNQAGKITSREFIKYENGAYASYKTTFERTIFALNISIDKNSKINGLLVKPFKESNLPKLERNQTKFILPFKGEWTVFWGGDTKELNYHVENEAQKGAFDIIITDENGKSHNNNGERNEDYFAFEKELIAPCEAEVVLVVDGIKDNKPGEFNPIYIPGNTVILKTNNGEYLFFAHFKQNSIIVKQGQKVKKGELLGLCGNSGNSSEPHLHFHIQNVEDMNKATGAKSYFEKIYVNGELKKDYSPIKNEKIKNK
jgi:murein DD-endopeptidase MepM/ murein hydrolase activator NlpD